MALETRREIFNRLTDKVDDKDILREVLYELDVLHEEQVKTRSNTSKLVWFLVVVPYIIALIYLIYLGTIPAY